VVGRLAEVLGWALPQGMVDPELTSSAARAP
jgi:hypothetical protein